MATGIGLGTTILNNVRDVRRWHKQTVVGDFYVSTLSSNPVAELSPGMPAKVLDELKAVPGVTNVVPVRFFTSHVDDQLVMVIAGDYAAAPQLPLDLEKGDPEAVARQLQQGEVVIGAVLAQRTGLRGRRVGPSVAARSRAVTDCRHGRVVRQRRPDRIHGLFGRQAGFWNRGCRYVCSATRLPGPFPMSARDWRP